MKEILVFIVTYDVGMIFRKEPFFYGHDNYDQLVKIARVSLFFLIFGQCMGLHPSVHAHFGRWIKLL